MQNDLISRSALLEIFNHDLKCFETDGKTEAEMYISVADMRRMIEEQPTAYSVEKVVAELEKRRSIHNELSQSEKLTDEEKLIQTRFVGCFTRAIAIVRNGGKE